MVGRGTDYSNAKALDFTITYAVTVSCSQLTHPLPIFFNVFGLL